MYKGNGFTLIEIMICIVIFGIIVALILGPGPNNSTIQTPTSICISGYKFLPDGKTQIKNEQGGGIPCSAFN